MRHIPVSVLAALTWLVVAPLTNAAVPPLRQAQLDKAPVIFTGTVVSRRTSVGSVMYCDVDLLIAKTHPSQSSGGAYKFMHLDNSNSILNCLIGYDVTLTLSVAKNGGEKLVHGYYEAWVTTEANSKLPLPLPPPPETPNLYGTYGIGAQIGDLLKVYENNNGDLWGAGSIKLIKAGALTRQMYRSYGTQNIR